MPNKLKPCLCGKSFGLLVRQKTNPITNNKFFFVRCPRCGRSAIDYEKEITIELWNRREA